MIYLKKKKSVYIVKKFKFIRGKLKNLKIYNLNNLIFLRLILSHLNKKGKINIGYFIFINILFFLKKKIKKNKTLPRLLISYYLNKIRPYVLLQKRRKGTLFYELPRFINWELSNRKAVAWFIQILKKSKSNIIDSILNEFNNIDLNKSEVIKKNKQIIEIIIKNKPFFYLLKKKK